LRAEGRPVLRLRLVAKLVRRWLAERFALALLFALLLRRARVCDVFALEGEDLRLVVAIF